MGGGSLDVIVNFELLSLLRRLSNSKIVNDSYPTDASRCIASGIICLEIDLKCGLMVIDF